MALRHNKKGQAIFFGMMTAIVVFVVLVMVLTPLKDFTNDARDADSLNCTNTANSNGVKISCVLVDWYMPYFICAAIAVAIGYITGRKAVQVIQ